MVGLAFMATLGAAAPAAAQSIDQRSNQQGQRIRQGERTGALTQPKRAASDIWRVDSAAPASACVGTMAVVSRLASASLIGMQREDSRALDRMQHNYRRY